MANAQPQTDASRDVTTSAPTLNFYGVPGLIDMPGGEALPDGQVAIGVSSFAGQTRTNFTFQFSPRISVTFRYVGIQDWNSDGFGTYRDRSFDFRYLLIREGRIAPALTIGLQDFAGTGIYAGEYVVATKTFKRPLRLRGQVKVTAGLGWGRLGSVGSVGSPFGAARPQFEPGDPGGEPATDQWFRGPVSPFGGVEWQVNERFGLKVEYATDAYLPETSRRVFARSSRFNFGLEYQARKNVRLGAYWIYGSEIGVNLQLQFNPKTPATPYRLAGPRPIIVRPDRLANPAAYDGGWIAAQNAPVVIRDAIGPELATDGIKLHSISFSATRAEARVSSERFDNFAIVTGRTARTMARILPPSVETFDIVLINNDLALSKVTLSRRDLETLEFQPNASQLLLSRTVISDAPLRPTGVTSQVDSLYPHFSWAVGPYIRPSFFDPDEPVRADVGISAIARFRFAPGWQVLGELRHRVAGTIENGSRVSDSVLPRVRTDALLYVRAADTTLERLVLSKQWKPGKNTYARISVGYLEQMFGGVSAELLWKPATRPLAVGVELNYVKQRDFDQRFGFRDYEVATGHLSAYYDLGNGYHGQLDVGRYLAGDVGVTVSLERQFANGWRIGGFFTLTDVSSQEFGEGSFDKGITVSIPLSWFSGRPSRQSISSTIRPVQRDGGARLNVSDRLYDQIRNGHLTDLNNNWGRVWQ
ncbi:YjbH domain-containing protein [uncultured Tateyamaria sp.]|uniref:YjbH domain-containing protein n=1 Tax=uncultured Tateyamaria sp. TaxID=455651 RepID=UPI0026308660|nr:YjbH domain-containing protein [uncultured Tateyamaria sp.]